MSKTTPRKPLSKIFVIASFNLFLIMGGLFLWQNNEVIKITYNLKSKQADLNLLQKNYIRIEQGLSEKDSFGYIEEKAIALGLEKTKNISFIKEIDSSIVRADNPLERQ